MRPKAIYVRLGAPLKNTRRSWGAVRSSDRSVILSVFHDDYKMIKGHKCHWLSDIDGIPATNLGAVERLYHARLLQAGYRCIMLQCDYFLNDMGQARIKTVREEALLGGDIVLDGGSLWIQVVSSLSVDKEMLVTA